MFKEIKSLKSGHYIVVEDSNVRIAEYWDLDYPKIGEVSYDSDEGYYIEALRDLLAHAVKYRLQADVPVGFYLSGGLDSSLIAAMIERWSPGSRRHSFSIGFNDEQICEAKYQRLMSKATNSVHHEITFDWPEISQRLSNMIYHCECPVRETYNTCSMALSEAAKRAGITVILILTFAIVLNVFKLPYAMWFKVVMLSCFFVACYLGGMRGVQMPRPAADSNTE